MANLNNIKLKLRTDISANWWTQNPILNKGEVAVVQISNDCINLKIGDGTTNFRNLHYLYQDFFSTASLSAAELSSTNIHATTIAQGLLVDAVPTSLVAGIHSEAKSNFSVAQGIEAHAKDGDDYSYVWNGTNLASIADRYESHGEGSFSINPKNGLSGFYVGQQNLSQILDGQKLVDSDLDNQVSILDNKKMEVNTITDTKLSNLNANKLFQTGTDLLILDGGNA